MKNLNTLFIAFVCCAMLSTVWTSCSSGHDSGHDTADHTDHAADQAAEAGTAAAEAVTETTDALADSAASGLEKMDDLDPSLVFEEGSWAWNIQQYMSSGSGAGSFTLDKISEEKGELSAEGAEQLDKLAAILKANPTKVIDLKAHSKEAKNELGRTTKKAGTKARALWAQEKLKARGVDGKQINAIGDADGTLLEGVPGDDDSQRRLTVTFVQ